MDELVIKKLGPVTDEEMTLNMGPHHPSTHGVLRFIVQSDGEIIEGAVPDVGYLHRSIEKIGERCTYPGYMPYTDRVDYVAAMFANEGWARRCEKLMGIEVPKRAQYLRVISCELNRIASHMISVGAMAMDIGATDALRPRAARARVHQRLHRGALRRAAHLQLPPHRRRLLRHARGLGRQGPALGRPLRADHGRVRPAHHLNDIYVKRLANVAVITARRGQGLGPGRPEPARLRRELGPAQGRAYSVYPELEFDVPVGKGRWARSATAGTASSSAWRR